jgi:hypothetical protein
VKDIKETCRSCKFFAFEMVNGAAKLDQGTCYFNPPIAVPMPGNGQMMTLGLRPPTKPDDSACSQYKSRVHMN